MLRIAKVHMNRVKTGIHSLNPSNTPLKEVLVLALYYRPGNKHGVENWLQIIGRVL